MRILFAFFLMCSPAFALPGPLAAKVHEIKSACGSKIVSAHRPGARTPSGHVSNHALGKAVDMQGNPACIYSRLRNWPGGVSTDYHGAPGGSHVHISYNPGGMEWGLRFSHRGGSRRAYASSRKVRYAQAVRVVFRQEAAIQ